jgi:hypothetical protein
MLGRNESLEFPGKASVIPSIYENPIFFQFQGEDL